MALTRFEMAHIAKQAHDFEITKHISLRQIDGNALLQLRTTDEADFSLPETLFDLTGTYGFWIIYEQRPKFEQYWYR